MTSASELFHNRRLRFGRNSGELGVGFDIDSPPLVDRSNRRHRQFHSSWSNPTRRDRTCDPLRRAPQPSGQPPHRRFQERELSRPEEGSHQFSPGNVSHSESHSNARDNLRFSGNDRLPGSVLLARERLLQRLSGITLSGSRRTGRGLASNDRNETAIVDDFRLIDAGDWETEIPPELLPTVVPSTNLIGRQLTKRPPGLTQEALNRLCTEVFCAFVESDELESSRPSNECSICLENFLDREELIRLPCGHRYHFRCLDPWVRVCGDCPYCRRSIDGSISAVQESP